ncbi:MAG: histidine kinase [Deltaproteobacteria bacterium]|nr:MAG: histidine kinase [Deltaproteobacteria bacterium]
MKVCDIMNKNVITCNPREKISIILYKLKTFNISGMPVVVKGRLEGIITRTDIIDYLTMGLEVTEIDKEELLSKYNTPVDAIMKRDVITVLPGTPIEEAAKIMIEHNINMLPVVQEGKLIGILTRGDIIKALAHQGEG